MSSIPGVITIDLRPFLRGVRRVAQAYADFASRPAVQEMVRRTSDRDEMRRIGARERREALSWLDQHVAHRYDDLGLERHKP